MTGEEWVAVLGAVGVLLNAWIAYRLRALEVASGRFRDEARAIRHSDETTGEG